MSYAWRHKTCGDKVDTLCISREEDPSRAQEKRSIRKFPSLANTGWLCPAMAGGTNLTTINNRIADSD